MVDTLTTSNFNFSFQESVYHGKVRDVYYLKNNLVVMVASDRISAFDVVMPRGIPYKGQILNQIAIKMMDETKDLVPKNFNLYRMYINCFAPSECPYFHTDGEGITFLYYPNLEWNLQDGGETQFYVDGNILGVPPAPNRLVMFDGEIVHRATSFRDRHRFTVAIKYT